MSELPGWRVWIDEERGAAVRRTLDPLAATLLSLPSSDIPSPPGLTAGLPGVALAHAYLAQAGWDEAHADRCYALLEESLAGIATLGGGTLAMGLAGLGFVLEHLGATEETDVCAELDVLLLDELRAQPDMPEELLWGVAGRAVYARERLPRPGARRLLDALVERLLARARPQDGGGLAWFSEPHELFAGTPLADINAKAGYNLGVAHGNPGILALVAASAGEHPGAADAARAAMGWLWAQRFPSGPAAFPIGRGGPPFELHGWCYGDEGVGAVLFAAARALGDEAWQGRWLEVLHRAAARAPSTARGLTLCHGSAGMAHLWNRVYQASGDERFAVAARGWLDATLEGLAREQAPHPGLLDGTAGVALALVGFVSDLEPAWDRLFALSLAAATEE